MAESLALSAHHECVPGGRDQIVALTYDFVIFVAVIAENFLSEIAHVTGDRELAELHVAAHFLDRGLGMKSAAVVLSVCCHHRRAQALVDIGKLLSRTLLMLQAVVRPGDRNPQSLAHPGKTLDMIECLRAFHAETVDDKEFLSVVHPGAQSGRERVSIAEVDADDPPRPRPDIGIRIERPDQRFDRKGKHARDAELGNSVDAGFALVRKIIFARRSALMCFA